MKPAQLLTAMNDRHRRELGLIHKLGECSRSDLHERLGIRRNTVTDDVAFLMDSGLVEEGRSVLAPIGRPRKTLALRPDAINVVGLAIEPRRVLAGRVNMLGEPVGESICRPVNDPKSIVSLASHCLRRTIDSSTAAIGLSIPGYVDPRSLKVLVSAAWPGMKNVRLGALKNASGDVPLFIANTTTVIALRWLLEHGRNLKGNHLVVYLTDGQIGASLLVAGRAVRGPFVGANELGHNRLPIDTAVCYCGHTGCIERIFSTPHLKKLDPSSPALAEAISGDGASTALDTITECVAITLSNAINFCSPAHVTLITDIPHCDTYLDGLIGRTKALVLSELADFMTMDRHIDTGSGAILWAASAARMAFFQFD